MKAIASRQLNKPSRSKEYSHQRGDKVDIRQYNEYSHQQEIKIDNEHSRQQEAREEPRQRCGLQEQRLRHRQGKQIVK
jgi:hypothetical protein